MSQVDLDRVGRNEYPYELVDVLWYDMYSAAKRDAESREAHLISTVAGNMFNRRCKEELRDNRRVRLVLCDADRTEPLVDKNPQWGSDKYHGPRIVRFLAAEIVHRRGDVEYVIKNVRGPAGVWRAATGPLPTALTIEAERVLEPTTNAALAITDALVDMTTHRRAWLNALYHIRDNSPESGDDVHLSYWNHEIKAFERASDILGALVKC